MTRLTLQAMVTKTATFDGAAVDVSAVPASQATLVIHAESLAADDAPTALLTVEHVAGADFTSGAVTIAVKHFSGTFTAANDKVVRIPWYDIPVANYDAATAKFRLRLMEISGTNAALKYEAWIEY